MAKKSRKKERPSIKQEKTLQENERETLRNLRHEMFCQEYIKDLNAKKAYLEVYKCSDDVAESCGSRLLGNVQVLERIDQLLAERSERTKITADYVLNSLQELAERCMQKAPVMVRRGKQMVHLVDEEGRHVWKFDSMGANAAFEKLGKHLALFTDKLIHANPDGSKLELGETERAAKLAAILATALDRSKK